MTTNSSNSTTPLPVCVPIKSFPRTRVSVIFPDTSPNSIGPPTQARSQTHLLYEYSGTSVFRSINSAVGCTRMMLKKKKRSGSEGKRKKKKKPKVRDDQSINPWVSPLSETRGENRRKAKEKKSTGKGEEKEKKV